MSGKDEALGLELSEAEKEALGAVLAYDSEEGVDLIDRVLDGDYVESGVNRAISFSGLKNEGLVDCWDEIHPDLSTNDSGGFNETHLLKMGGKAVMIELNFPEYCDDECDGRLDYIEVFPASEYEDRLANVYRGIAKDAVSQVLSRIGSEKGLEYLMEAVAASMDQKASPTISVGR